VQPAARQTPLFFFNFFISCVVAFGWRKAVASMQPFSTIPQPYTIIGARRIGRIILLSV
jgi:hypothetical protein